jgi:bifunctional DNA-binding transcriptional regulator/antitoxin component of YhaV-PrlF toxin-antitoxin module
MVVPGRVAPGRVAPGRVAPGRVVLGGVAVIGLPVKEVALEEEEARLEEDDRLELVDREEDVRVVLDKVGDRVVESVEAAALLVEESELEEVRVLKEEGALDDVTPALLDIFVEVELFEVLVDRADDMEVAIAGAWVGLMPLRSGDLEYLGSSGD